MTLNIQILFLNSIGHLKNVMGHPEYKLKRMIEPSDDVRIRCYRLCLDRAIKVLEDIVGTY